MYRFRRIWLLVGCGMVAAVVVLSLIPVEVDLGEDSDKLAHFLAYGSLSLWFGMIFTGTSRQFGITVAIVALGVVLEFLQGLTGYRTFSIADMIANALGAALGWGLAQTPLKNGLVWIERRISGVPSSPP
jgi:VanZ family protein